MSTWRMVRVASTWGLSVVTAPAEVRRRSVTEGAAGVALDAGLVRLHQAAIPTPAGPEHLQAGMGMAARGGHRRSRLAALKVRHRRLQGGHARLEIVGD